MTPHRIAAGLAGLALGGVLAACSGTPASSSGYAPITAAQTPAPVMTMPGDPTADASGVTDPTSAAAATSAAGTIGTAGTGATGTRATGTGSTGTASTGTTRTQGTARTAPQQAPPDYTALARQFAALRDSGTTALATVKGQASSSDLNADKKLMAYAATVFANYGTKLNALPFPAQMKADEQTLAKTVAAVQATFVQASQVKSFDALNPLLQQLANQRDDQLNATNVIEKDLGLPMSTPDPGY
jgi:hypothetical protein